MPYHELRCVAIDLVVLLSIVTVSTDKKTLAALCKYLILALVVPAAKYLLFGVLRNLIFYVLALVHVK